MNKNNIDKFFPDRVEQGQQSIENATVQAEDADAMDLSKKIFSKESTVEVELEEEYEEEQEDLTTSAYDYNMPTHESKFRVTWEFKEAKIHVRLCEPQSETLHRLADVVRKYKYKDNIRKEVFGRLYILVDRYESSSQIKKLLDAVMWPQKNDALINIMCDNYDVVETRLKPRQGS